MAEDSTTASGQPADGPRQWKMFAGRITDRGRMHVESSPKIVRMYGDEPVAVIATEDPAGTHYGWIYADDPGRGPVMIQPHEGLFSMQFPYGPEAEAARGKGEIVRLRVEDDPAAGAS